MDNPFFSVIVPAYNAEDRLARGLNSIEQQTFRDFELIVVCDSCTDKTEEIASNYTDRVFVADCHLDGVTRDIGMQEARGEWLLFMDDDDWWARPDAFQIIADAIKANPNADVLCYGFHMHGYGDKFQDEDKRYFAVWSKAWRRAWVEEHKILFPAEPYWSDVTFHRDAMAAKPRIAYLDSVLYYYNYLRPGSISWRKEHGEIT